MPSFKIDYTWNRRELFEIAKAQLVSEGWTVGHRNEPAYPERTADNEIFFCWFERTWKLEDYDITPKLPKGMIKYVNGDATQPIGVGNKVIVHCCNDIGAWGAGFVMALSKRWSKPENDYRNLPEYPLGNVRFIQVEPDIAVANMIGQHGVGRSKDGVPPVRYEAIRKALKTVNQYCLENHCTVHAPKFGSDLAGGDWNVIEQIIKDEITVDVTIYNFVK